MPSEIIEPSSGPADAKTPADVTGPESSVTDGLDPASPPQQFPRTGSTDDLTLALEGKPDPLLGAFDPEAPLQPVVAEAAVEPDTPRSSAELDVEEPLPLQPIQPPGSFEAFPPTAEPVAHLSAEAAVDPLVLQPMSPAPSSGSFDDLVAVAMSPEPPTPLAEPAFVPPASALELDPKPEPEPEPAVADFGGIDLSTPTTAAPAAPKPAPADDDDDDYEDEPRGLSLGFVLLMSYASAVTIGLLYVLITGRTLKHTEEADFLPPVDERADPGQRAKFSRKLAPPPPIKPEHLASLGKTIRAGQLEITPLDVSTGPIILKHLFGGGETKKEGADALRLRLRLKNVSKDLVYAPLDEAFLREREAGVTDSYVELPDGQKVELHQLAVTSEWGIVGQEFQELKPGETLETLVVSEKDALKRAVPQMTWRVRLRTGVDQTDYVGVRFSQSDVKRAP